MKCAAAYARQSVEKKNSVSISGQLDLCRRAAGEQELKIYQDAGYSGKNTERPDFQRLLKDIRADRISTLYVYRLDRFSRSVADFGQLWEILRKHHVEFVSVSENFDTSTPMGRAMLHIIMVFAQLERETTAERVRDNYYRRLSLGAWPGGPAPYGFTVGRARNGEGQVVPTLLPNEKADIVLRIYQMYGENGDVSLRYLAKTLMEEGIPGPGGKHWDNCSVSRILHNPTYVMADEQVRLHYLGHGGNVVSPQEAFDGGHGLLLVGKSGGSGDNTVSVLNSVGLVPADLWLRCQEKLARNRQIGNTGRGTHSWLSGLMKCAKCGYSLNVAAQGDKRWLLCSGRYNRRCCDAVIGVKVAELEAGVEEEITKLLAECPDEAAEPVEDDGYAKRLEELERRADRLLGAFAENGDMSNACLHRALGRLEEERQALLEAQKREMGRKRVQRQKLAFSELSFYEKKMVAAQFVERIEAEGDSAEVRWRV